MLLEMKFQTGIFPSLKFSPSMLVNIDADYTMVCQCIKFHLANWEMSVEWCEMNLVQSCTLHL